LKVIKPQRIALLYKAYEHLGSCHLCVTAALYFPFSQPDYLLPEIAMWKQAAKELGKEAPLDMCMPKPRGEALVVGKCFAPGGDPVRKSSVRLTVGDPAKPLLDKRLHVFGDRQWRRGIGGMQPGEPAPFLEMPVDYAHAFGGAGFPHNPLGKGAAPLPPAPDGNVIHPLANIEEAAVPILTPDERPAPASLAPLDFMWPQRASKAGTYDEKWLKERFPAYADDMDVSIFNAAPEDQWLKGYFAGDEPYAVAGMHPAKALVQGRLPGAALRCFIDQSGAEGLRSREVTMRAETLWLFPHLERGILIYRGVIDVATDDAEDVVNLLIAAEAMAAPRGAAYYRDALARRLDPKEGAMLMLRDDELLPPLPVRTAPFPDDSGADDWIYTPKGLQGRRLRTKMANDLENTKAKLVQVRAQVLEEQRKLADMAKRDSLSSRKDEIVAAADAMAAQLSQIDEMLAIRLPAEEPPATLEELPALKKKLVEAAKKSQDAARVKIDEAESKARQAMVQANGSISATRKRLEESEDAAARAKAAQMPAPLDYDQMKAQARHKAGGPPKPFADQTIAKLKEADAGIRAIPARIPDSARTAAQSNAASADAVGAADAAAAQGLPVDLPKLERHMRDGEHQLMQSYRRNAHMMLPAARMSVEGNMGVRGQVVAALQAKQSLAGADFTGADLSNLDLRAIDLQDALLEAVDFSGSDLSGAKLDRAVLVRARFIGARLTAAHLEGANLGFADFSEADASDADMRGANLANTCLYKANFTGARLDKADLLGAQFAGANFTRVTAPETNFIQMDLRMPDEAPAIDFEPQRGPDLDMRGANFAGANLEKARFVHCIVEGLDFSGANLAGAVFVAVKGDGCVFRGADLTNARFVLESSFADCDFSGARLDKANLRGTMLANGDFSACSALAADFSEATLSRARFPKVLARGARFAKADLTLAQMQGINLIDAVLQKANLHGAQLQGANLFGADLLRIRTDEGTDLSRTNTKRTLAGATDKK
jgi:uncharacterized protein YjbI with pentapeptide repeats